MDSTPVRMFKGAILFGLIGPVVGAWVFVVLYAIYAGEWVVIPIGFMFSLIVAHLYGGLAALATGAIAGALRPMWRQRWLHLDVAALGAAMSIASTPVFEPRPEPLLLAGIAVVGAVAAMACAAVYIHVFEPWRRIPPATPET
ncbi:hypothetical protein [Noviluteimonas gilva]|uniref:Uncharacterized protein n=1 Tax=Noviluteimonas gilva TaxID=2682097 RepID=A0A7C9LNA9_9GAMM|nr:hypothetical protein [Lysobacter gilvus]MUV14343.1 hypothetical protein [Lysobacter gilvus]